MRRRALSCGLLALGLMGVAGVVRAEPFRILHAEQIELPFKRSDAAAASKPQLAPQFALSAYGRQLDLQIEQNASLTRSLRPEALAGNTVYRGEVTGIDGSWARLTVIDGETYGAIWDGVDLYSIAPGHEVSRYMDAPLPQSSDDATFVYRLSDTQGGVSADFCGVSPDANQRGAALEQFRSLIRELKSLPIVQAPGDGPLQIEVALLADYEFHGRFGDAQSAMLARANVVDGIFDDQLGVAIIATDFTVFNDSSNPFSANDGPGLLTQLSTYRNSTPVIRDRGLAHLFTGKDLAGDTAGIAFIDALCEPAEGVGVTEGWRDTTISALIMAHELGHNFGAPHDGQTGACETALPAGHIMAPIVSYASTFSSCSITQMQPRIAAASCVVPLKVPDVTVQAGPPVQAYVGETFELVLDVRSVGDLAARNVVATAELFNLTIESAEIAGGSCTHQSGMVDCRLESLAPGDTRRVTVRARGSHVHTREVRLQGLTQNDRNRANDTAFTQISFISAADVLITSTPTDVSGLVRTPIAFSVTLESLGPRDARNVSAHFMLDGLQFLTGTSANGTCAPNQSAMICTFTEIPSGQTRRIDVTAQASIVNERHNAAVHVAAENDANDGNNSHHFPIRVIPERDLAVQAPGEALTALNQPVDLSFVLRSLGVQATEPGTLTFSHGAGAALVVESVVGPGGACDLSGDPIVCTVPSIEAGGVRTVVMRARGLERRQYQIQAVASSPEDDAVHNNMRSGLITAVPAVDAALNFGSSRDAFPMTGLPFVNMAVVRSFGANAATDVVVRAVMPPQLAILGATFEGGECNIAAQVVTCTRASLPRLVEAALRVETEAIATGAYSAQVDVSATGDADTSNNQIVWTYTASQGVDVSLDPGAPLALRLGATQSISVTLRNGNAPASNAVVELSVPSHVSFLDGVVEGASCSPPQGSTVLRCHFGPQLAANASRVIQTTIRANYVLDFVVTANVTHSHTDVRPGNNTTSFPVTMSDRQGDARPVPVSATATGRVGQEFVHPHVRIEALTTVDEARVSMSFDPSYASVVSAVLSGGACAIGEGSVQCALGTLEGATSQNLVLTLRGARAGSFSSTVTVASRNDANAANDTAQVAINVTDSPPPAAPSNQGSGGGSGGGGALDSRSFLALLAFALLAHVRRRAQPLRTSARRPSP